MPREGGMTYPASRRHSGQVRRAALALARAAHFAGVIGRTGLACSIEER
jgi:hypothetical protein